MYFPEQIECELHRLIYKIGKQISDQKFICFCKINNETK